MGMSETATRIIARYGLVGSIERTETTGGSELPPGMGGDDPVETTTNYPATMAIVGYDLADRDGTLIGMNDLRVIVSTDGLSITPKTSDLLVIGGTSYTIANVTTFAPDGSARFFDLQVKR